MTGKGKGTMIYDIENKLNLKYENSNEIKTQFKVNELVANIVIKNSSKQTVDISKNKTN
ncbi:hypothetical protein LJC11_01695 [Bacteroidales bacterium OttesenSCG-928-I21]|nr:hypothetical protein [Bacteroidales bacterium OttesenSCG-928-I21]